MDTLAPRTRPAPKLGLLINSNDVFSPEAKDRSEDILRRYFDELKASGLIAPESVIYGRIFGPHEATAAADEFAAARVDLVVIANIAFPNGQVFLTLATHPNLAKIPLAVIAEPEPEGREWATNAWCGVIMNNHVAKQIGREITAIPGPFDGEEFRNEFERLLRVAGTIRFLRNDLVCRFGDAPPGFHSATADQLAFAAVFGTRVETVDLTAVMDVYRTGKARGHLGQVVFSDEDVQRTVDQMLSGRKLSADNEMVERAARLYQAFHAIIRANGYTSASVRCWPEFNESYIGICPCVAMGTLLANRDVTAVGCEGDWPMAVAQTMATLLSGVPAPCLDWVNYTPGSSVLQTGHCGMGIAGQMTADSDEIAIHPVQRLAGAVKGPVNIGQFKYGPKTAVCLTRAVDGKFRLLAVRGESSEKTARGLLYSAADFEVEDSAEVGRLIFEGGFPHHLTVALGDITEDLRMLCRYLGVEYISPRA